MNKLESLFKKIVFVAGLFNFPIGLGLIIPAFIKSNPDTLITDVVLGAFLICAGIMLIWASYNLNQRAPIIVWSGLVRLLGFITVFYTNVIGSVSIEQIVISYMDLVLAFIFTIGSVVLTKTSFIKLFFGKVKN